ncbi:lipoprotein [soil metagenome]
MHLPRISRDTVTAAMTRRRITVIGVAIVVVIALPISILSFREKTAEAQNPMGDAATADAAIGAASDVQSDARSPAVSDPLSPAPSDLLSPSAPAPRSSVEPRAFGSSRSESAECLARHQELIASAAAAQRADSTARRPAAGRDPARAERFGWYPKMPDFRDGALLPCSRIVAYYGHPSSTRMGVLGEYPKDEMLRRLRDQVAEWERADPGTPVIPALHMVAVVAQGEAGRSGHYRTISTDERVQEVYDWAREANGIFIFDIQTGTEDLRHILPRFEWILRNPDVHVGVDPEFMMRDGVVPGRRVGTMDAADVNFAIDYLARVVNEHNLPPKVLIIHRFTRGMVTNSQQIRPRPEVQVVMHMDGHGRMQGPAFKYDTYAQFIVQEPVQFAGWKNFYLHDNEKGVMPTAADLMRLHPLPLYLQYQ